MLQKKYDDELNDLVPFAVESLCLLCEESSSARVCVDGCRKHSTRRGAGGRADGHSRLKGAWMRLGQKSCDGERLKSSTVVDVLLLCGHLWLPGRGLAAGSSTRHRSDDREATTAESCPQRDVTAP